MGGNILTYGNIMKRLTILIETDQNHFWIVRRDFSTITGIAQPIDDLTCEWLVSNGIDREVKVQYRTADPMLAALKFLERLNGSKNWDGAFHTDSVFGNPKRAMLAQAKKSHYRPVPKKGAK